MGEQDLFIWQLVETLKRHIFSPRTPHDFLLASLPSREKRLLEASGLKRCSIFWMIWVILGSKLQKVFSVRGESCSKWEQVTGLLLPWLPLTRHQHKLVGHCWTCSLWKFCRGHCCRKTTFTFKHRQGSGRVLQISRRGRSETLLEFHGFQQSGATWWGQPTTRAFVCVSLALLALGSLRTPNRCSYKFYLLTFILSAKLPACISIQKASVYKIQPFCPEKFVS